MSRRFTRKKDPLVEIAEERVPIEQVISDLGSYVSAVEYGSRKINCPFGCGKVMRVYAKNSAWCFECSTRPESSVSLYARGHDLTDDEAAVRLLDAIGYRPLDLAARWEGAIKEETPIDRAALARALTVYCETHCRRNGLNWTLLQFETEISDRLDKCLGLLDLVESEGEVQEWLRRTKKAMTRALNN